MQSTLTKLLEAARHLVDTFIDRLPSLILAIAVFIAFYALSRFAGRLIREAVLKRRQNLALVFAATDQRLALLRGERQKTRWLNGSSRSQRSFLSPEPGLR